MANSLIEADFVLYICSYGDVRVQTLIAIEELRCRCPDFPLKTRIGDALIGRARSISATEFLKLNTKPYMVFVDSDIWFQASDFEKLLGHLRNGYDLVGGCYAVKGGTQLSSRGIGNKPIELDGTLQKVDFLATGFMGISHRLLKKIREEFIYSDGIKMKDCLLHEGEWCECYPFFESGKCLNYDEPIYISEDWDFCNKARQVGIDCYLDSSIWLKHMTIRTTTVEEAIAESFKRSLTKEKAEEIRQYAQKLVAI